MWDAHQAQWQKLGVVSPQGIGVAVMDLLKTPAGATIARALAGDNVVASPRNPHEVYLELVHMGVDAYKAWQLVRKKYPGALPGYFPKGDPAARRAAFTSARTSLPSAGSQFATVDPEGAPDINGVRHHAAYDWMLGGNAPVPALAGGKVIEANPSEGDSGQVYGGTVKIQLADGRVIVYRHVIPNVKVGARVAPGQRVATVVNWRDNPGSSHTHVEVWKTRRGGYRFDNMEDPLTAFGPSGRPMASGGGGKTPNDARQYAFSQAKKYKWGSSELNALDQLWNHESGWDYTIKNPHSGAAGIPQALGHTLPPGFANNPRVQINWGLRYIKGRYKTPSRAWAFWRATVNHNANLAPPDLRGVALQWISKGYEGY